MDWRSGVQGGGTKVVGGQEGVVRMLGGCARHENDTRRLDVVGVVVVQVWVCEEGLGP
jgi:hypothetical protein